MPKDSLKSPELYVNRELSWLEFNQRVLEEGLSTDLPPLERLKFLSIVSSNLDEFYLVRVAGLMQQKAAKVRRRDPSGMTPAEQLTAVSRRVQRMYAQQAEGIRNVLAALAAEGLVVWRRPDWTPEQQQFLRAYFTREILPLLTPLSMEDLDPRPLLPSLQICVAAVVSGESPGKDEKSRIKSRGSKVEGRRSKVEQAGPSSAPTFSNLQSPIPNPSATGAENGPAHAEKFVVVPIPTQLPRWITLPSEEGLHLAWTEEAIAANLSALFPGSEVQATAVFRIARDADVVLDDEEVEDLLRAMEKVVQSRRRRAAVRLTLSQDPDPRIRCWLVDWLKLDEENVFEVEALAAGLLMDLALRSGFDNLKIKDWPPQTPRDLLGADDLWAAVQDHDVLLFHPYESFDPVVRLVEQAAADPQVLAIKQTLYRTSGDSPVVQALGRAAQNGKEVTVLVELKARFDESRNIQWARRLEDAGVHVIYGVAGLKTHAKALLIVRREAQRLERYVHLATGNYNDRTARLYSDIGLLTCDKDLASDVAAFFNLLTGYSEPVGWSKIRIAPSGLKEEFINLIEREIQVSTADRPGLIMAKINSLQDPDIVRALYRASRAGVKIRLNVRGICCLRPGVPGVSEHIEVRSIVDRFLEHARVYYFRNGGHEEVYLSSADWMRRNLKRRLEILFPVVDRRLRQRLIGILETCFADNQQAWRLNTDGTYDRVARRGSKIRAQQQFYQEAVHAARQFAHATPQFRPLTRAKN
ncbi:MAG: polyphosphate kinase 1 [Pirellulales bacterium]|nr:polyphosphate kinase 1 [Pirellulales bacterium]